MKKVIVSTPVKGISVSGDYLVVELSSGITTIEKPRYIGFHSSQGVLDIDNLITFVGLVFILLVLGVFIDLVNIVSPTTWYAFTILFSGLLLFGLLVAPRRNVLVIETSNKTYYFTRPHRVDERLVREIVAKMYSSREHVQLTSSTIKSNYSFMVN